MVRNPGTLEERIRRSKAFIEFQRMLHALEALVALKEARDR